MKKKLSVIISVIFLIVCFSAVSFSAADTDIENLTAPTYDKTEVLKSRFLNMLNHNFVYDDNIEDVESIVNCSMPALLDMCESLDDSFISQDIVSAYIYDMYGVGIDDYSEINVNFPQKQGYVYIIPRGFTVYSHEMVSVVLNEDGSYTVKTKVYADAHDSEAENLECTTLFVENENSTFGFNIIRSDISSLSAAI